jgi:hypothetical protein
MPNSTTNPPVEISIPPWTVATTGPAATGTPTLFYYHCSRVFASGSCVASGVNVVAGSATGAVVRVFLLDLGGNILASSAVAGTALTTASGANAVAFSTPYAVVGPQAYFIAVQATLSTANHLSFVTQTVAPAGFIGNTSADVSAASLATPTSGVITPPTAYVSAKAPVVSLY